MRVKYVEIECFHRAIDESINEAIEEIEENGGILIDIKYNTNKAGFVASAMIEYDESGMKKD